MRSTAPCVVPTMPSAVFYLNAHSKLPHRMISIFAESAEGRHALSQSVSISKIEDAALCWFKLHCCTGVAVVRAPKLSSYPKRRALPPEAAAQRWESVGERPGKKRSL